MGGTLLISGLFGIALGFMFQSLFPIIICSIVGSFVYVYIIRPAGGAVSSPAESQDMDKIMDFVADQWIKFESDEAFIEYPFPMRIGLFYRLLSQNLGGTISDDEVLASITIAILRCGKYSKDEVLTAFTEIKNYKIEIDEIVSLSNATTFAELYGLTENSDNLSFDNQQKKYINNVLDGAVPETEAQREILRLSEGSPEEYCNSIVSCILLITKYARTLTVENFDSKMIEFSSPSHELSKSFYFHKEACRRGTEYTFRHKVIFQIGGALYKTPSHLDDEWDVGFSMSGGRDLTGISISIDYSLGVVQVQDPKKSCSYSQKAGEISYLVQKALLSQADFKARRW